MANNTSILINVGASTAGAVRNLHKVTNSLEDQKKISSKWGKQMFKASNLAKAGFAAVGLAAIGAAASMIDFGKEALEDQKQAVNLANTLKNIPKVTQTLIDANADWIDSMELATNIADTDLRASMGRLALVTQDVAKAQDLVALAADVSIGRNISLSAATKLVEKAATGHTTGHTEALMKQMPWLDKNKDGILSTSEAIDGLGDAYEGAAKKAADNDPWQRLKTIWGQLKEALGQWLLPLLKKFGDWFKDENNQRKVKDMIDKVADLSYEMGTKLAGAIQAFYGWLTSPQGQQAMKDFKKLAEDIWGALKSMVKFIGDVNNANIHVDLGNLESAADLLDRINGALKWFRDHSPINPFKSSGASVSMATASTSYSSVPIIGTQNVYATFNLTGSPAENVREFDRYLRRAGNRSAITVTA